MTNLLQQLITIPTISSQTDQVNTGLEFCRLWLKRNNISTEILIEDDKQILLWGCDPSVAEFMFNTHIDVVPALKNVFAPRMVGNRIYGRGSCDAKACVVGLLEASLQTKHLLKSKNILFSIVSDEEIGGNSTKKLLKKLPKLKFAIFGEPTNLKIVNKTKGVLGVEILSKGKSAHGAHPWKGLNAIQVMAKNIVNFMQNNPIPITPTPNTTFNISVIAGGKAKNQIPDSCAIDIDIRFNSKDKPSLLIKKLKTYFIDCKINILKNEPALSTPENNIWVQLFGKAFKANNTKGVFVAQNFSSDARHCVDLHIPAIIFGPTGGNMHENNEWVNIQSINKYVNILNTFIHNLRTINSLNKDI